MSSMFWSFYCWLGTGAQAAGAKKNYVDSMQCMFILVVNKLGYYVQSVQIENKYFGPPDTWR